MAAQLNGHVNAPPAVEVRKLTKTYATGIEAVKAIDFTVEPGEVFGLLGPNGAGKSTTIGMLTTTIGPVPRPLLILGNLVVVLALSASQIVVVIIAAAARGADLHVRAAGLAWFVAAAVLFIVLMYGIAETLAARIHRQEEYIGATPAIAILPWFFAGALFPIGALPGALTAFAKVLPLTHAMALMRYGLVDPHGTGLHDIWGMSNTTTEAWLSLAVVVLFAVALFGVAIRAFGRPPHTIEHGLRGGERLYSGRTAAGSRARPRLRSSPRPSRRCTTRYRPVGSTPSALPASATVTPGRSRTRASSCCSR
jgi:energy-coupling factor transporter ATP-binding protein EcfA2